MINRKRSLSSTFKLNIDPPSQLGELLLKAGLITQTQLDEVAKAVESMPGRLGQMLVMSGYISHKELQDVLQIQCLLREKLIDKNVALQGLRLCRYRQMDLRDALNELQMTAEAVQPSTRLGDLLIEAEVIDERVLQEALTKNTDTGLPLGRILVLMGVISDDFLVTALHTQMTLRRGEVSRLDAMRTIRNACEAYPVPRRMPAGIAPPAHSDLPARPAPELPAPDKFALIDFLVLCKAVDRASVDSANLLVAGTDHDVTSSLLAMRKVTVSVISIADRCCSLANAGLMTLEDAVYSFDFCNREVNEKQVALEEAAEKLAFQSGIWAVHDSLQPG